MPKKSEHHVSPPLTEDELNATRVNTGTRCRITFDDGGQDALGRRHFTLEWNEPRLADAWLPAATWGMPSRRGQCFFTQPEKLVVMDAMNSDPQGFTP